MTSSSETRLAKTHSSWTAKLSVSATNSPRPKSMSKTGAPDQIRRSLQRSSWMQRLFILVLACNMVLILWGIRVVPVTISSADGIGRILADIALQAVIGLVALWGPLSFQRHPFVIWVSLLFGLLFAISYDGMLLLEYVGIYKDVNVYFLFVGAASLAGFIAGHRTRRLGPGVIAGIWTLVIGTAIWTVGAVPMHYAFWGSQQAYVFWQNDGAIEEFHHSGMTDLNLFLIQDIQG